MLDAHVAQVGCSAVACPRGSVTVRAGWLVIRGKSLPSRHTMTQPCSRELLVAGQNVDEGLRPVWNRPWRDG